MWSVTPGHHLYDHEDGRLRYLAPDGGIVRVSGPRDVLTGLLARCGPAGTTTAGSSVEPPAEVADLAQALRSRGVLRPSGTVSADGGTAAGLAGQVLVVGEGPVAEAVADLLRPVPSLAVEAVGDTDGSTNGFPDEWPDGARAAVTAVVSIAGHLPDEQWRREDGRLAGTEGLRDALWQRCHLEGGRWVVGPVRHGRAGPTWADTRGRLLAAAPDADETSALWRALAVAPPPEPPDAATAALVAGLVVRDLMRVATAAEAPAVPLQHVLDPDGLALTSHPVLPLPTTWDLAASPEDHR